jgi:uncharacterized protein (DUF2141 family)
MKIYRYSLILCSALFLMSIGESAVFQLTVTGIKEGKGQIMVGVYDNSKDFPEQDKTFKRFVFRLTGQEQSEITLKLGGLQKGNAYALAVYHDKNSNGKLDKNFLGAPTEIYGFSNNARGVFGPPSFADAAITIDGSNTKQRIHLK